MDPKDRLIIALDVDTEEKALALVDKLKNDVHLFKVGFELFSSCGPDIVEAITKTGCRVFLDLKFHDIPNTVSKAAVSITALRPFMFNVHALGGYDMMKKTSDSVKKETERLKITRPRILAVTILTGMDENALKKVGIDDNMGSEVLRLATLARDAGLDGVVASPQETALIRERLGKEFLIVTPGVRPAFAKASAGKPSSAFIDDQKRVATPEEAVRSGASFIVVGRPVTEAKDPAEAARKIIKEINA